jgi:hypothetical protein
MRSSASIPCVLFALLCGCSQPKPVDGPAPSKYAGEETRAIKTLSQEDVDELLGGGGWGFAKAAELNGVPGPLHVLELRGPLGLSSEQVARVEDVRREMKAKAVPLGIAFVEVEQEINDRFARREMEAGLLRALLDRSARVRSDLAFVHLEAHLKTAEILTPHQVTQYSRLRGYDAGDPCRSVPEGHDPELWKKHNGCED